MRISKSKFVAGCQCLKRLYWQVHEPELAAQPDAASGAIIEQGRAVGLLGQQLFPGGIEVRSDRGLDQAIRATRELVANPEIPALYEAVFQHGGLVVKVDILHRRHDGRWRLIEVKSTSDVKDHHYEDVAIQYRVVSRSGLDLASACLAHVNRGYTYPGGEIDPRRFFRIRNLTRRVQRVQPKLTFQLRSEFTVLGMPQPPSIAVGKHCASPVLCEFYDRCNLPRSDDHIGYQQQQGRGSPLPREHVGRRWGNGLQKRSVASMPKKKTMSAAARRKIAAAQRARWARVKASQK